MTRTLLTITMIFFFTTTLIQVQAQEANQVKATAKWTKLDSGKPTIEFTQGTRLIRATRMTLKTEEQTIEIRSAQAGLEVSCGNTRFRMKEVEIMSPVKSITVTGISKQIASESIVTTQVYSVADLLDSKKNGNQKYDRLMNTIVTNVAPKSWEEVGGVGSLAAFPTNGSLVVQQTRQGHKALVVHLAKLRKVKAQESPAQGNTVK